MSGYNVDYSQPSEEKEYWQKKASKALDKQIPKTLRHKYKNGTGVCDDCGFIVSLEHRYCAYCGQRLAT